MPTATLQREHKTLHYTLKASSEGQGIIEGYASVFGNQDSYKDVVVSGAYKKTVSDAKSSKRSYLFPLLYQHDPNLVIGGVIEAKEDAQGLQFKAQMNLDTQLGRETYSNVKSGFLDGISVGYDAVDKEYKDGIRYLKQIRLWEISVVTFPANTDALVTSTKNTQADEQSVSENHTDSTEVKQGAMFSQNNRQAIQGHVNTIREHMKSVLQTYFSFQNVADDLENILGNEPYDPMPKSRPFVQTPVQDTEHQPAMPTDLDEFSRKAEEIQRLLKRAKK